MLAKHSQGPLVKKLQQKLAELGYAPGAADGIFGQKTEAAVLKFQTDHHLDIDGIVGDQTWNALFQQSIPKTTMLNQPPPQSRCFDVFGNHQLAGWDEQNIVHCDLSAFQKELDHVYRVKEGDRAFTHVDWFGFPCHRLVAPHFQQAFAHIVERGLAEQVKTYGGCLNKRLMRGGKTWSMHSWGIALDLNPQWNPFGQKNFAMSKELVACFEDVGFIWGGRWTNPTDAMHFQYATVD